MLEWLAPATLISLLGALSVFIGRLFTRHNDKDTLLLASRDSFIDDLRERLETVESKVEKQEEIIKSQGEKIRQLEASEWSLRRYAIRLIEYIRGNNLVPPTPPANIHKEVEWETERPR